MDLKRFGQTLRQLRKVSGLTQSELAHQLGISEQLLSIWERAYKHGERVWQPDRPSVVRLVGLFADRLTMEEAQIWANQAGYTLEDTELTVAFPQAILSPLPTPDPFATRLRLDFLPDQRLFGVDEVQAGLGTQLEKNDRPWLIAIDGLGGMGKTSLAHALALNMLDTHHFYDLAWISARQEEFLPEGVVRKIIEPALTPENFVDILLTQLDPALGLTRTPDEKLAILTRWLKSKPYLVVVDNLETVVDYETLLPMLQRLTNPTKFLITSRYSLRSQSNVHCHSLRGLNQEDAYALLRHEGEIRSLPHLAQAAPEHLDSIRHYRK